VDEIFFDADLPAPSTMPVGPFVMHAAGATERKNLHVLADAWRAYSSRHPDVQLVLAGPVDERRTRLFTDVPGAMLVGRLHPAEIAGLLHRASAVVVPSRYEGFGLPALEGMAAGRPVVAAATGALPEVCGDAALLVEPTAEAIADALERATTDDDLIRRLELAGPARARQFTWRRAAEAHLDVYRDALA
jgi:glycosyltransferase involved in cell wall biosynthesis